MQRLKARKRLGQHFLVDSNIARKVVRALDVQPDDVILEIGAGQGALTRHLLGRPRFLVLVEIDPRAVQILRSEFTEETTKLIQQDFLEFDLRRCAEEYGGKLRVVGNLPYNITSPILFRLIDACEVIQDATLMVQLEVGQRIVARPRTKDYGILSVFCQYYSRPRLLFKVSPNAFSPKPNVQSGMLRLDFSGRPSFPLKDDELFRKVVRSTFGKRRKTLLNGLRYAEIPVTDADVRKRLTIDLSRRPEDLTVEEFVQLTNEISDCLEHG